MAKFNLLHCIPHPRMHGLNGYKDVIDSVEWGLTQMGHKVTYRLNSYDESAINIVFGAQVLPLAFLQQLPSNSIVYNFEQLRGRDPNAIRPEVHYCAQHFQIWDYSETNLETWRLLGAAAGAVTPKHVPVAYAPVLARINKPATQDIDVLIYGMGGDKRADAFNRISRTGISTLFACGLYGAARDELIARSKIVLNINLNSVSQIFEIVRVSYLFANKKAIVATLDDNTFVEDNIRAAIKFTTAENIARDCLTLSQDDAERARLEQAGYAQFTARDIVAVLREAL
jgi:hypothetical protein